MANRPKVDTAALQDELAAAKEEAAQLRGTAAKQEKELEELRSLNRRLQWQLLQSEAGKGIQTFFGDYAAYSFRPYASK